MVSDYPRINNWNINNIDFKTGDILSISYTHIFGSFITLWSGSTVSHPGIVYKNSDGEIFIFEGAYYGEKWKGIFLIPIKEWLRLNGHHDIFYSKYYGIPIADHEIESVYKTVKGKGLESLRLNWIRLLKKEPYEKIDRPRYVCYEMVVHVLQELKIVQKKYLPAAYWPSDICYGRLDYEPGHWHAGPVYLRKKKFI